MSQKTFIFKSIFEHRSCAKHKLRKASSPQQSKWASIAIKEGEKLWLGLTWRTERSKFYLSWETRAVSSSEEWLKPCVEHPRGVASLMAHIWIWKALTQFLCLWIRQKMSYMWHCNHSDHSLFYRKVFISKYKCSKETELMSKMKQIAERYLG